MKIPIYLISYHAILMGKIAKIGTIELSGLDDNNTKEDIQKTIIEISKYPPKTSVMVLSISRLPVNWNNTQKKK